MVDMDWSSLFKSFYETARVKIACRNPAKIPRERLFEMGKKLFLVSFTVEDFVQELGKQETGDDGDNPDDEENDDEVDDLDPEKKMSLTWI